MTILWFPSYEAWQTEFFVILDCFLPFYPPNNPKNQNFEKLKKAPGDTIILHKCTKNYDHMLYGSWDMVRIMCYFSFWAMFCPFTPLTAQKIKILQKWNNGLEKSSFYICVSKIMIRWCTVPEILCMSDGQMGGRTDRQTDGQMEKVTYRGGYPTSKLRITSQKTVRDHSFITFTKFSEKLNVRIRE